MRFGSPSDRLLEPARLHPRHHHRPGSRPGDHHLLRATGVRHGGAGAGWASGPRARQILRHPCSRSTRSVPHCFSSTLTFTTSLSSRPRISARGPAGAGSRRRCFEEVVRRSKEGRRSLSDPSVSSTHRTANRRVRRFNPRAGRSPGRPLALPGASGSCSWWSSGQRSCSSSRENYFLDCLLITTTIRITTRTPTTVQSHIPPPIHPPAWFIVISSLGHRGA